MEQRAHKRPLNPFQRAVKTDARLVAPVSKERRDPRALGGSAHRFGGAIGGEALRVRRAGLLRLESVFKLAVVALEPFLEKREGQARGTA